MAISFFCSLPFALCIISTILQCVQWPFIITLNVKIFITLDTCISMSVFLTPTVLYFFLGLHCTFRTFHWLKRGDVPFKLLAIDFATFLYWSSAIFMRTVIKNVQIYFTVGSASSKIISSPMAYIYLYFSAVFRTVLRAILTFIYQIFIFNFSG